MWWQKISDIKSEIFTTGSLRNMIPPLLNILQRLKTSRTTCLLYFKKCSSTLKSELLRYILGDNFRSTLHVKTDILQNNEETPLTIHLLYVCVGRGILIHEGGFPHTPLGCPWGGWLILIKGWQCICWGFGVHLSHCLSRFDLSMCPQQMSMPCEP